MKTVSIVIPAYNEENNIIPLFARLQNTMVALNYTVEYLFVDDGSHDATLKVIQHLASENTNVYYVQFSRNFGHQCALKAGLDLANGDCVISMDSDLQHPPEVIPQLIAKWEEGFDVVYTKRKELGELSWFKRKTSKLFYKTFNQLSGVKIEEGAADFRLMSRSVVNVFRQLKETELFIRGLVKWAGFRQTAVEFTPAGRHAGETKYTIGQMLSFAFKGLTSFSTRPLKLLVYCSLGLFLFSMILVPYALVSFLLGVAVSGWTSIMIAVVFFGSLQLLMIGVVGLYISKLVIQSKQRPTYIVRDTNYRTDASK
ncbi:MAG: glycosyltransferase family 2 protein [Bacteroidota bacterium]